MSDIPSHVMAAAGQEAAGIADLVDAILRDTPIPDASARSMRPAGLIGEQSVPMCVALGHAGAPITLAAELLLRLMEQRDAQR